MSVSYGISNLLGYYVTEYLVLHGNDICRLVDTYITNIISTVESSESGFSNLQFIGSGSERRILRRGSFLL